MLDNLEHDALFDVARTLKAEHVEARLRGEGGRGFLLESSGGIEEDNLDGRLSKGAVLLPPLPARQRDCPLG
jgi:hypothetical protein